MIKKQLSILAVAVLSLIGFGRANAAPMATLGGIGAVNDAHSRNPINGKPEAIAGVRG